MSSLDEARRKIEERRQQQASQGGQQDLWLQRDDLVIAHFLCTGGDNDPYFDTYVVHEYPAKGQGQWPTAVYCPVESGHDQNYDCPGCRDGIKQKDRMLMWFWVYDILHATLKQGWTLPQVNYNNKPYFRREVNGPKLWDTSAWKQSCLDDILMLGAQLGNLQASRVNITATGDGLDRRYKIYMEPNSPALDPAFYEDAKSQIQPVVEILMAKLQQVPTMANPNAKAASPAPAQAPSGGVPAYTPPGGASGGVPEYKPAPTAAPNGAASKPTPTQKRDSKKLF